MCKQNKSYELSYAELKKFKGFEDVSENEANEICFQLKELSFILFEIFQNQQRRKNRVNHFKKQSNERENGR
jgi:hypothetical protein